jgi:hypothetical protein
VSGGVGHEFGGEQIGVAGRVVYAPGGPGLAGGGQFEAEHAAAVGEPGGVAGRAGQLPRLGLRVSLARDRHVIHRPLAPPSAQKGDHGRVRW